MSLWDQLERSVRGLPPSAAVARFLLVPIVKAPPELPWRWLVDQETM